MAKYRKGMSKETPMMVSTSLSDMIFMLLFFFMATTSMRKATVIVRSKVPIASEVKKLENKALVSYINIGAPLSSMLGTATRVQLNDKFSDIDEIQEFIASERERRSEADQKMMTTALRIDENVRMGTVTDVKQTLRKCGALKIAYMSNKGQMIF
jgi:biopolymer transport protein ExbD